MALEKIWLFHFTRSPDQPIGSNGPINRFLLHSNVYPTLTDGTCWFPKNMWATWPAKSQKN